MPNVGYNERSWAIDLISDINLWANNKEVSIKRAGGENTVSGGVNSRFPDVLIFGDEQNGKILQGWELKFPDTNINDQELLENAAEKARLLGLDSFLVWNVTVAILYKIDDDDTLIALKTWNDLNYVDSRDKVQENYGKTKEVLYNILEELNNFIQSGDIRTSNAIDVLSSEQVSGLIHRNIGEYEAKFRDSNRSRYSFKK